VHPQPHATAAGDIAGPQKEGSVKRRPVKLRRSGAAALVALAGVLPRRFLCAAAVLLTVAGCSEPPTAPNLFDVEPADDRGPRLASVWWADDLTWHPTGIELFYRDPFTNRVSSVTPGLATVRVVYASLAGTITQTSSFGITTWISTAVYYLQRPGPGTALYLFETPPSQDQIVQIDPAGGTPVTNVILARPRKDVFPRGVAVSSTGRFVAFGAGHGPGELNETANGAVTALPPGEPLSFSPDGQLLLYRTASGLQLISTMDVSSRELQLPGLPLEYSIYGTTGVVHFWRGNDPQVLLADTLTSSGRKAWRISVYNSATGNTRELALIPYGRAAFRNLLGAVSPGGERLVVWDNVSGDQRVLRLYTIRLAGGGPAIAATVDARNGSQPAPYIRSMAFSPDGHQLAYSLRHQSLAEPNAVDIHLLTF
jgi:hypothetical protein